MSDKARKVWVLTREHNDYDQHGEYFVAVFESKPSHSALAKALSKEGYGAGSDVMAALAFLEHMLSGGGRQQWESVWFNLGEVSCEAHK